MTSRFRQIATILLFIFGVQLWLVLLLGYWGPNVHLQLLLVALAGGLIPPVRRGAWKILRHLRRPAPKVRLWTALAVTLIAGASLGFFAVKSGRKLFPTMHDEFQFLLQARMVASGRLWMPGHPLADFFDTFYVLIQPKYAAQSFPGTAILYAPAILLHIAPWIWSVGIAAVTVGLMYRVTAELVDGLTGLLAAALLEMLSLFRYVSTMVLAQTPLILLGLLSVWVYLRWRRSRNDHSTRWAILLGLVCGWMLLTRPADALIFILPLGLAMFWDLRRRGGFDAHSGHGRGIFPLSLYAGGGPGWGFLPQRGRTVDPMRSSEQFSASLNHPDPHPNPPPAYRERGSETRNLRQTRRGGPWIQTAAAIACGAAPWLALQIIFNIGVTGNWRTTPFAFYNQRDQPRLTYGLWAPPGDAEPASQVLEKRQFYDTGVVGGMSQQSPRAILRVLMTNRLPSTLQADLTQPMLMALIPIGLLAWRRRAWILAAGLPLFFLLYAPYPIFTAHYPIAAAPATVLTVLLGFKAIELAWPRSRAAVWTVAVVFVAGLAFTERTEGFSMSAMVSSPNPVLKVADQKEAELIAAGRPAVILFTRDPQLIPDIEPVYNIKTLWPDDALVIRAQDRGDANQPIYQYYATHGPDREFYRFDESRVDGSGTEPAGEPLTFLGMASELAKTSVGH
jgi:hypothetical protein